MNVRYKKERREKGMLWDVLFLPAPGTYIKNANPALFDSIIHCILFLALLHFLPALLFLHFSLALHFLNTVLHPALPPTPTLMNRL